MAWAGDTALASPEKLDAIIDTTPAWTPVVEALKNLKPGALLSTRYARKIATRMRFCASIIRRTSGAKKKSRASPTSCADVGEFLELAAMVPIKPEIQEYVLEDANQVLIQLKAKKIRVPRCCG